jgi:hypothetical protein
MARGQDVLDCPAVAADAWLLVGNEKYALRLKELFIPQE